MTLWAATELHREDGRILLHQLATALTAVMCATCARLFFAPTAAVSAWAATLFRDAEVSALGKDE